MTLDVDVMHRPPLPVVRLVASGVPAGTAWTLHGSIAGARGEWLVADGVSTGSDVVTADPWAPIGAKLSYRLTFGTTVQEAGPVVRGYSGGAGVPDPPGRPGAPRLRV